MSAADEKFLEYERERDAGNVIHAAKAWREYCALVETDMASKRANERELTQLQHDAG